MTHVERIILITVGVAGALAVLADIFETPAFLDQGALVIVFGALTAHAADRRRL